MSLLVAATFGVCAGASATLASAICYSDDQHLPFVTYCLVTLRCTAPHDTQTAHTGLQTNFFNYTETKFAWTQGQSGSGLAMMGILVAVMPR
jgi:hypothetical protein